MNKNLKVGAIVRFLNAVGGGRVARITKDTAWVEDTDGFEIPTPINECVVVDEGDTFVPKYKPPTFLNIKEVEQRHTPQDEARPRLRVEDFEDWGLESEPSESEPQRLPHTFLPARGEARACWAFVPQDLKSLGATPYRAYLINDSQYSLYYVVSEAESKLVAHGLLHPNDDVLLSTLSPQELNRLSDWSVQLLAIAENPGIFKAHISYDTSIDPRKLLKDSSFVHNDYFDVRAYILPITAESVAEDKPQEVSPEQLADLLRQAIAQKEQVSKSTKHTSAVSKPHAVADSPVVVDLHIEQLLDHTRGMSATDILSYQVGIFNEKMREALPYEGRKIIFIHGKGDGVLRNKIIAELRYRYKHCHYQDASFEQYSYGATQVTIRKPKDK